jgi:hypothetical protein
VVPFVQVGRLRVGEGGSVVIEFEAWLKIFWLNRDIVITEKLDGTNAAIVIDEDGNIGAQSRKRLITPENDNHGFAAWVQEQAPGLIRVLGPGRHFGEWWGSGINRGYGFTHGEKYFSLFNTNRWDEEYDQDEWPACLSIVPILYQGPFSESKVKASLRMLRIFGSMAHHGFDRPEGIVMYHKAANMMFKVTLENDEAPKGLAA